VPHIPKTARYTLGEKVDAVFADTIELVFVASYAPKEQKAAVLGRAIAKLDLLKFFLQLIWEVKALDNKKYVALSEPLAEIGRMLGGWSRQAVARKETPA
jgi:hypothetical protein